MRPSLVGGPGLFATCGAVAIDKFGWGLGGAVADVVAGAASGCHCTVNKYRRCRRMLILIYLNIDRTTKLTEILYLSTPQSIP